MNLPGIGKTIINELKDNGLIINILSPEKFNKQIQALSVSYKGVEDYELFVNALYVQPFDTILLKKEELTSQEYLLLHESIHAIRSDKRLNRMNKKPLIHDKMKMLLKNAANGYKHKTITYKSLCEKTMEDMGYWREESIADCLSIFFCTQYGSKIRRSSIDTKRLVFLPLGFEDAYTDLDKNNFLLLIKKECILTLNYISDNYLGIFYDKKLIIEAFEKFFEKEIEFCFKQLKKLKKCKLKQEN